MCNVPRVAATLFTNVLSRTMMESLEVASKAPADLVAAGDKSASTCRVLQYCYTYEYQAACARGMSVSPCSP